MHAYFELAPPERLVDSVECFWVADGPVAEATHRVVPDGCADILYTRTTNASTLLFIGAMTRYQDFPQLPGSIAVGMRFRPAMWADIARANAANIADRLVALDELWAGRARFLARRLDDARPPAEMIRSLAQAVAAPPRSPLQNAVGALERSHGLLSLDQAANLAGLSTRQFRHRCLDAAGLSPKLLSRILRFRRASRLASGMERSCCPSLF